MRRRQFLEWALMWPVMASAADRNLHARRGGAGRVVVVGAGYGGATAAKQIRVLSRGRVEVILIDQNAQFISCPVSNRVLSGQKTLEQLSFGYDRLQRHHGVKFMRGSVTAIDAGKSRVVVAGQKLAYDRLVVAPGIDFIYDAFPMLAGAQEQIPHAWKAGPQTRNLHRQLLAMRDGGVFTIAVPPQPYRCPPAPYERACQVAFYLKTHKPRSRVMVLDANPVITSKRVLFERAFHDLYPGMIEYVPGSELREVDVATKTVKTTFETLRSDVLNIIPPQRAGRIAQDAGLANIDGRWCEVDVLSYESKLLPRVHVLGDAIEAGLPKSAHMANAQAKICARAVVALMLGQAPDAAPAFANTCYSFVDGRQAMHISTLYRYEPARRGMQAEGKGVLSEHASAQEGMDAEAWARQIWADTLD
ncbi:Sulfide dehydrogenase [flavocytochrome c] flavoprotein chain [Massilia sp. Bi118]|uniref:NAD(P)/FAD-dependent oxidoreductase n=1 Tax=Massilia sp. Bi118 TaxID=2822346 RepID=UPI001E13AA36|nr:NAD(P)/FAD-dependent oxidoreductase [Massilia sp. Bi118]CAH0192949.1 Sulfide dehydrogenase [flavocytochrome c] flavoprotein chain [Massilia sp. Bi118]